MTAEPDSPLLRLRKHLLEEVERTARALQADIVTAIVYDEETGRFHLPVDWGLRDRDTFEDPRMSPRSGRVGGMIVRERRPIIAEQVVGHSPMDGPFARREGVQAAAGFPLIYRSTAVGVLFISYRQSHHFDSRQQTNMRQEAEQLATLIGTASPWAELRRMPKPERLGDDPVLQSIVDLACDAINLSVAIWLLQPDGKTLRLVAGTGLTRCYVDEANVHVGDGSRLSQIVESDGTEGTAVEDLVGGSYPFKEAAAAAAWVAVLDIPVRAQGRVCGVVEGLSFHPAVNPVDRGMLHRLARLVGVTVENNQRDLQARLLRKAVSEIERESARLVDQDREFEQVLEELRQRGCAYPFHYAALQLKHPREPVIETVAGVNQAAAWQGLAKHYLDPNENLRDIDADIFLAKPPRVEIIEGNDPRFDVWILKTFQDEKYVRVFVPLLLARDAHGRVLGKQDLDDCLRDWKIGPLIDEQRPDGRRRALTLILPERSAQGRHVSWEVIGTIEAGCDDYQRHTILLDQAVELARSAAGHSRRVYRTLLQHVFQIVVDHAVQIVGANYASLHFDCSEDTNRPDEAAHDQSIHYIYQVASGEVTADFLRRYPPRQGGLGQRAIAAREAKFIPNPAQEHNPDALQAENPKVYAEGIRALAAIPLLLEPLQDAEAARGEAPAPSERGVLYVGFSQAPGEAANRVHRFTSEERGWLELFANSAADAIRHATAYTKMRTKARLLTSLNAVAKSLVSVPENPELLNQIAWNALNILGADVVTIYEYLEHERTFLPPPDRAGHLLDEEKMTSEIGEQDTPFLIVKNGASVYAPDSAAAPLLNPPNRRRPIAKGPPFVEREHIKSSAGILLIARPKPDEQEVVGVMFVNYRRPNQFPEDEKRVIETFASAAAVAITNRRLVESLLANDRDLLTAQNSDDIFARIAERARELTRARLGELFLIDPLTGDLRRTARSPAGGQDHPELVSELHRQAFARRVADNKNATLVASLEAASELGGLASVKGSALGVPLCDADGRVLGVLAVFHSRPRAFHSRNRTRLEALAIPAVLALHSDESRKRLRASGDIATLGWLSSTLLHRIGTHFGLIHKWAKTVHDEFRAPTSMADERANQVLDLSRENSQLILDLAEKSTQRINAVRRWEEERREQRPVQLDDVIRDVHKLVAWPTNITTKISLAGPLPPVLGDRDLFFEVFLILFRNAIEAMTNGGRFTVHGTTRNNQGRVWVVIRFVNTGKEIPEDILARFRRGHPVPSKKGLGLGLYLSRTYVEHQGGYFDVESSPDKGTEIILVVPAYVG